MAEIGIIKIISLAVAIVPIFFWLWFWLKEDSENPEPKGLLAITFLAGALGVLLILPLEQIIRKIVFSSIGLIIVFATIEELIKYLIVYFISFKTKYLDEPIDYAIYLITGALGFATLENILFLLNPIFEQNISFLFLVGNVRFLGAVILHSLTAAFLGIFIALAFYKKKWVKKLYTIFGLLFVISLHSLFNFFIIEVTNVSITIVLGILWVITIFVIYLFEKIRSMQKILPEKYIT